MCDVARGRSDGESFAHTVPVHSERIYFRMAWNLISGSVHTGIPEVFVVVVVW